MIRLESPLCSRLLAMGQVLGQSIIRCWTKTRQSESQWPTKQRDGFSGSVTSSIIVRELSRHVSVLDRKRPCDRAAVETVGGCGAGGNIRKLPRRCRWSYAMRRADFREFGSPILIAKKSASRSTHPRVPYRKALIRECLD
jgi:hypothetical protein